MDLKVKGKNAIITGAGKGIGKACALAFAAEGINLCLNDLDVASAEETVAEAKAMGVDAFAIGGNVASEADMKAMFKAAFDKFGRIDIVINNAGISPKLPFYEITPEMFSQVLDINLKSTFICCKEAYFYMKDNGWGRIVNLSSLAGLEGGQNSAVHYSASKAGILGLTKTLARQMGQYGITVHCVAPGRIDTAMTRMLSPEKIAAVLERVPLGRLGTVEEVAKVILFLASDGGSYITGTCVEILGGYHC